MLKNFFNKAVSSRRFRRCLIVLGLASAVLGSTFRLKGCLREEARQAWATQYPENPRPANNDPAFDVFRHAYTSARLTQRFGPAASRLLMDGNELLHINDVAERRKDTYNNDVAARAWGGDGFTGFQTIDTMLAEKIRNAISGGVLKTDSACVPAGYRHWP